MFIDGKRNDDLSIICLRFVGVHYKFAIRWFVKIKKWINEINTFLLKICFTSSFASVPCAAREKYVSRWQNARATRLIAIEGAYSWTCVAGQTTSNRHGSDKYFADRSHRVIDAAQWRRRDFKQLYMHDQNHLPRYFLS